MIKAVKTVPADEVRRARKWEALNRLRMLPAKEEVGGRYVGQRNSTWDWHTSMNRRVISEITEDSSGSLVCL